MDLLLQLPGKSDSEGYTEVLLVPVDLDEPLASHDVAYLIANKVR